MQDTITLSIAEMEQKRLEREKYAQEHKAEWRNRGESYERRREALELSTYKVGQALGVSSGRIKRFEAGEPILEAELLEQAYKYFLKYAEVKKMLGDE